MPPVRRLPAARDDDGPWGADDTRDGAGLAGMNRGRAIAETARLVAEGERLEADPTLGGLRLWLQLSDDLLSTIWGTMDRYHLAWLLVGRPAAPRGRAMTPDEEAAYVRDVVGQKTAVLRMSLHALEAQGVPFVGETGSAGRMATGDEAEP